MEVICRSYGELMKYQELPGIYRAEGIETKKEGVPVDITVRPGMITFTRAGRMSVVSASTMGVMAYVGSYKIEADVLKIAIESCVHRGLEGKTITRKILSFDGTRLALEVVEAEASMRSVLAWTKEVPL